MGGEPVRRLWTRPELIEALKLYCLLPFGQLDSRNRRVRELAVQLGRTSGSVALKLVNFAALDPTIDRKGMANASALDRQVWNEFFADMGRFVSAPDVRATGFAEAPQADFAFEMREGRDVVGTAKRRVNQLLPIHDPDELRLQMRDDRHFRSKSLGGEPYRQMGRQSGAEIEPAQRPLSELAARQCIRGRTDCCRARYDHPLFEQVAR